LATIENSDQFADKWVHLPKGKYGKLEYRMSYNKPFAAKPCPAQQHEQLTQFTSSETRWLFRISILDLKLMYPL
jgi:hypothetical protein